MRFGSLDRALSWAAPALLLRPASQRLVAVAYHNVRDPMNFARHIDYLTRAMHPVALDEVLDALTTHRKLPPRAVLITFDDADPSVVKHALPLLQERGVRGVVFAIAGLLDTEQPFWWEEVEELVRRRGTAPGLETSTPEDAVRALKRLTNELRLKALADLRRSAMGAPIAVPQLRRSDLRSLEAAGIRVGNHTLSHPCLDLCTDAQVAKEVREAHEILTAALGSGPRAFAYPNGNYDPRAARVLEALGYEAAFLFDHRMSGFPPRDRFQISRVRVNSTTSLDRFRLIVSGLHPALHHALGRL
jgi:peptidoglycan/xylan/chitin deacetylase (PgdA/CDA1 family)